jgi:peroxiredoxin
VARQRDGEDDLREHLRSRNTVTLHHFIVDPEGRVAQVLRKVKPAEHDELVLAALRSAVPPAQ